MSPVGTLKTDQGQLAWRWAGQSAGSVLLLSHWLGGNGSLWAPQIARLGQHFRLLIPDHRGHGSSEFEIGDWSIADLGGDVINILDEEKLDRVHFCGLSLGGFVGVWLAENQPERIDHLVAANTGGRIQNPTLLRTRMQEIEISGLPAIEESVMSRWLTAPWATEHPEETEWVRREFLKAAPESYVAISEALCRVDLLPDLASIQAPTLAITSPEDRATPPEWGLALVEGISGAKHVSLPCAHLSAIECADAFSEAVLSFLGVTA